MYRTDVYFLSKTLAEAPLFVALPVLFTTICYFMVGFNTDLARYFTALLIVTLVANVATSFGEQIPRWLLSVIELHAVARFARRVRYEFFSRGIRLPFVGFRVFDILREHERLDGPFDRPAGRNSVPALRWLLPKHGVSDRSAAGAELTAPLVSGPFRCTSSGCRTSPGSSTATRRC